MNAEQHVPFMQEPIKAPLVQMKLVNSIEIRKRSRLPGVNGSIMWYESGASAVHIMHTLRTKDNRDRSLCYRSRDGRFRPVCVIDGFHTVWDLVIRGSSIKFHWKTETTEKASAMTSYLVHVDLLNCDKEYLRYFIDRCYSFVGFLPRFTPGYKHTRAYDDPKGCWFWVLICL